MPGSRSVAHQLTTTNTQGDPQVAQLLKLLHEFKIHIRQDRSRTIRDIAEEVEVGYGTCQSVLREELGMHHVAAKFVPRTLAADQKQQRVNVCTELRQLASDDETFLSRVMTGDESWVYSYSPNLAPCDFFLFPKKKLKLKGRRFDTVEEIQAESQIVL
jgi:hypothetical protein